MVRHVSGWDIAFTYDILDISQFHHEFIIFNLFILFFFLEKKRAYYFYYKNGQVQLIFENAKIKKLKVNYK